MDSLKPPLPLQAKSAKHEEHFLMMLPKAHKVNIFGKLLDPFYGTSVPNTLQIYIFSLLFIDKFAVKRFNNNIYYSI